MFKLTWFRTVGLIGVGMIGIAAVVSGQDQGRGSTMDQLLAEVQGLRSEFSHATGASIRAQLLVARLQLQEQRIANIARQISEIQTALSSMEQEQAGAVANLRAMQDGRNRLSPEQQDALERQIEQVSAGLEQNEKRRQELRAQGTELENVLTDEQARWTEFNGRLDELELSLPR